MKWVVVRLKAIATEDEGWRQEGDPLWPERWPLSELIPLRDADATVWESSYQQMPTVAGGFWFRDYPPNFYEKADAKDMNVYLLCDPALFSDVKRHKRSDYTVIGVIGTHVDGNIYLLDGIRKRVTVDERADHFFRLHRKWRPITTGYEEYGLQSDIVALKAKMERENYRFLITELGRSGEWHNMAKERRVETLISPVRNGRVYLPNPETKGRDATMIDFVNEFITEEWNRYPATKYDDVWDMLSRINDPAMKVSYPMPKDPDAERSFQWEEGTSWMRA